MDSSQVQILIAMMGYMCIVVGIGLFYAKKANESTENYLIGEDLLDHGLQLWQRRHLT